MDNSKEYINLRPQEMAALPNLIKNGCATVGALRNDPLCEAPAGLG